MSIITAARITALPSKLGDPLPEVFVTAGGQERRLFAYYPDEISFRPEEFVGLTVDEAFGLKLSKDLHYVREKAPTQ